MLDNQQYQALIEQLFPDNSNGEISEADIRKAFHEARKIIFPGVQTSSLDLEYSPTRVYDTGAIGNNKYAEYNNKLWKYISTTPANGITPVEGTSWTEVSPTAGSQINEWQYKSVYNEGIIIVLFEDSFYKLLEPNRPFQTEDLTVELDAGKWKKLGSSAITGSENNTVHFSPTGEMQQTDSLQNNGTDITIKNKLNVNTIYSIAGEGRITTNSSNLMQIDNNNGGYNKAWTYYDNINAWFGSGVGPAEMGIRFRYAQRNANEVNIYLRNNSNTYSCFHAIDNETSEVVMTDVGNRLPPSTCSSFAPTYRANVRRSHGAGGSNLDLNEDDTLFCQRMVITEHAKFLNDPSEDLDFNDRSLVDKKYTDTVAKVPIVKKTDSYIAEPFEHVLITTGDTNKDITLPATAEPNDIVMVTKVDDSTGRAIVAADTLRINGKRSQNINREYLTRTFKFTGDEWITY